MTRTTMQSRAALLRRALGLFLFITTFTLLPLACDRHRSDDDDGVDEAAEEVKDAVEEAGDEVKDAVEEAGDEVKDAVD